MLVLLHTDHVSRTALLEDFTNEFRLACCDEDKVEIRHLGSDQPGQFLLTYQLSFTRVLFKEKEVLLILAN